MAGRGAAVALFDRDGRILMIKEDYGQRRWGLPGGLQEPGEDPRQTAVREAKEETGLDVALSDLVGEYRISYDDGSAPLLVSVFYAEIIGGSLQPNEGEIAEIAWIDPDRLPEPLTNVAPAIPDAVRGVRGAVRSIRATSATRSEGALVSAKSMQELALLLDRHEASAQDEAVWSGGTIRLHIASYLSDASVPLAYVTSVRSIVLRGDEVLTMRNVHEWHVLPGGRRYPGETPEQTLRREIWEEAGVLVETPAQLGFMHLHHLSPQPPGYAYPYPDFVWLVYVAEAATAPDPDRVADDYEQEALFRSIVEAEELELSIQSRLFLDAARRIRRG